MKKVEFIRASIIMLVTVVVFGLSAFGLNFHTGDIIFDYQYDKEFTPLMDVVPAGTEFTLESVIYDSANAGSSQLKNVSGNIVKIYEADFGYAVTITTTSAYSTAPMFLTLGVSKEGIITGFVINEYHDSLDGQYNVTIKNPGFDDSFVGKDTTLTGVTLVGGSTVSSSAIKSAVNSALESLVANKLIKETVKTPAQVLEEIITLNHSGLTFNGVASSNTYETIEATGNIVAAVKAKNDSGFAFAMKKGENYYYAVVNASGFVKLFDAKKNNVTNEHEDLVNEALKACSFSKLESAMERKARNLFGLKKDDAYTFTFKKLNIFNSTIAGGIMEIDGKTYYVFNNKTLAYGNHPMDISIAFNTKGRIVKISVSEFILEEDYYNGCPEIPADYLEQYIGKTAYNLDDEDLLISGATVSVNTIKNAIKESFDALNVLKQGGNQ
jgi:hypothetical protein